MAELINRDKTTGAAETGIHAAFNYFAQITENVDVRTMSMSMSMDFNLKCKNKSKKYLRGKIQKSVIV